MHNVLVSAKNTLVQYLNVKFQLFDTALLAEADYKKNIVDAEKEIAIDLPLTLEQQHWKFKAHQKILYPETFVTELDHARVWGNQGAVITKDNVFFGLVSREYAGSGKHHSLFKQWRIVKHRPLKGRVAVIAASGNEVYYHWMFDIVPRIDLLQRGGLFHTADKFILNYRKLPYQLEMLAMLGIPEEKIIAATDHWNFHVEVETLVVPSLVSPNDCPSERACLFLRSLFAAHRSSRRPFRKIYIRRTKGRTIVNEPEISALLLRNGFEIVHPETMAVAEQARLFSEAAYVVAPHGAGLTNLVFCEPGTKVIDLFSPEWVNPCYWILSHHLQLRYAYLLGKGKKSADGVDPKNMAANMHIDPVKLKELMEVL